MRGAVHPLPSQGAPCTQPPSQPWLCVPLSYAIWKCCLICPTGICCGRKVSLLSTSPSAPIPPGTLEAWGRHPCSYSCAPWGMGLKMLGVLGMEEQDTPVASCCSTGGTWSTPVLGATCGIFTKVMPWVWDPYSS